MVEIYDEYMSLKAEDKFIATARFSRLAAADGNGARIVSTHVAGCLPATARLRR